MQLSWILLVYNSFHKMANIITKYQMVFLRVKFFGLLAIAKETYFNITVEKVPTIVRNIRTQLGF